MSRWRFVFRSLTHHWRIHLAVALGVAAATAVLTGALLVGDSVRGSLRHIALDRLGRIDTIVLCEGFFRAELASELAADPKFKDQGWDAAVPALVLQGTVEITRKAATTDGAPGAGRRAGQVTLLGVDDRFWKLGERYRGGEPIRPGRTSEPQGRGIVLDAPLAEALGAAVGDELVVRLPRASDVPADSPMGRKTDTIRNLAELEVIDIVPGEGLGRFSLSPSQQLPLVAFLHPTLLQQALDQDNKVNAILVSGPRSDGRRDRAVGGDLAELLRPSLEDFGLKIKHVRRQFENPAGGDPETIFDYFSLSSDRMLIPPEVDAAAEQAFAAYTPQPVYTYLANTIAKVGGSDRPDPKGREIPYSTIVAIDSNEALGPLVSPDGTPLPSLADDEIVLHSWAAGQLQAEPGDKIAVTFFEPESTHGRVVERTEEFRLKAVVPLTEPAQSYSGDEPAVFTERPTLVNDPDLTPAVRGVTDKDSLDDWDPPFPFVRTRIKPPDDLYWENHRTTPKAFVSLDRGRQLWESRFGRTTSFRIPAEDGVTADSLAVLLLEQLHRDRRTPGFTILPLRQNAIDASSGSTPFDVLFLGFSMFIIASALMLVALLFRLGIEGRAEQIGTLLAVGLRRRATARLFALEGGIVAAVGGILGIFGGIGYAWLMLTGLKVLWINAIVTPFVDFHYRETSLVIGYFAGAITALATFAWSIANLRRVSLRQLVAGRTTPSLIYVRRAGRRHLVPAWLLLVAAVTLLTYGTRVTGETQALTFFGAGASLLTSGLLLSWWWFRSSSATGGTRGFAAGLGLIQLALRNAARNAGRSTLTIGLMAAASFLIVAISAFQLAPSDAGTGGFDWIAETAQPIYQDLSDSHGRDKLGIIGKNEELLSRATVLSLQVQAGDDASCLNMFQAKRPRVIGVPPAFVSHFDDPHTTRFAFAAPSSRRDEQDINLWRLLAPPPADESAVEDDAVPVVLDKNTAMYALHLYGGVGEEFVVADDVTGRLVRFRVAGLLADSIFQGNLLIGEHHFRRLYPDVSGFGMFLIRAADGERDQVRDVLEDRLGDWGFDCTDAVQRMESLQVVQNTYLATFQSLGALGLLLGTFGLATVQLRSVVERRGELALMRATGFRQGRLAEMVLLENGILLIGGLLIGVIAALVTTLPHMLLGDAEVPYGVLAVMLYLVVEVGIIAGLLAVLAALRAPLIPALRGD